ncbi:MAG: pentapeptide repeat-containing protein [Burkholderiales bacterium]|jgi:hypothetical protein|nr:pentapeptide repeat-containing protein [Burkholderiales bacterium]
MEGEGVSQLCIKGIYGFENKEYLFLLKPLPRVKTETQKDHSRRSKTMKPTLLTAFCLLLITIFSCFHPAIAKAVTPTDSAPAKITLVEPAAAADNLQKLQETNACVGCDFNGISLKDLNLSSANLEGANLSQADLERTNLQGANLKGTNLQGADLGKTLLAGADLSGANLLGADLEKANLQGANLTNANLQKADLEKANLTNARLDGANLQDADGEGAIGVDPNLF